MKVISYDVLLMRSASSHPSKITLKALVAQPLGLLSISEEKPYATVCNDLVISLSVMTSTDTSFL